MVIDKLAKLIYVSIYYVKSETYIPNPLGAYSDFCT